MKDGILQDWDANRGNWKSCGALLLYRAAQAVHRAPAPLRWLGMPVTALYVLLVEWFLGIELNVKSRIGRGLRLYHGYGLVVHEAAVVGENCILRHNTTLGAKQGPDDCPTLGDTVDVGCNVVILGRITVGSGAKIGAGSVVVHDVAPGAVVAGNPARPIGENKGEPAPPQAAVGDPPTAP
jgi:putative colanic acid biosynthesis acetyltransferase WcaB